MDTGRQDGGFKSLLSPPSSTSSRSSSSKVLPLWQRSPRTHKSEVQSQMYLEQPSCALTLGLNRLLSFVLNTPSALCRREGHLVGRHGRKFGLPEEKRAEQGYLAGAFLPPGNAKPAVESHPFHRIQTHPFSFLFLSGRSW